MCNKGQIARMLLACVFPAVLLGSCVSIAPVQEQCGLRYEKMGKASCLDEVAAKGPKGAEERSIVQRYRQRYDAALEKRVQQSGEVPKACALVNADLARIKAGPGRDYVRKVYARVFKSMTAAIAASPQHCKLDALCSIPKPDKCTARTFFACTETLVARSAQIFAKDAVCEQPGILQDALAQAACLTPYADSEQQRRMADAISQHKRCICERGGQLMSNLVGGQGELVTRIPDILTFMKQCPSGGAIQLTDEQKGSFRQVMENALYSIDAVDLSAFSRELRRFDVQYSDKEANSLVRRLKKRGGLNRLQAEALNIMSSFPSVEQAGILPAFNWGMCSWAIAALEPTGGVKIEGARTLSGQCAKEYESWVMQPTQDAVRSKRYDLFRKLTEERISGTAVEEADWFKKAVSKVEADLEKSRKNLAAHEGNCGKGKAASAKAIAKTPDYGILIEERAGALERCLTAYDDFYAPKVEEALARDCRRGLSVLLSAVGNARGKAAQKGLAGLMQNVDADDQLFEGELPVVLAGPATPSLRNAALETFRCACAQHCLGVAAKALGRKDAVEALKAIRKANLRRHLKTADKLTARGISMLRDSLFKKASDAFKRSLPGVATLYMSIMDELFPAARPERDRLREQLVASLSTTIELTRGLSVVGLRRGGQLGVELSGQLEGIYRVTGTSETGTTITFQPRALEASWKTKRGQEKRVHKHIVETQVKNVEKYQACDELPQAQSELVTAEQAMQGAERLCKAAADRAARSARQAHWLLGAVTQIAGSTACNVAAEKLLVEKARERRDTLQYNCHELPPMVTKAVEKEYKFKASTHQWNYAISHKVELKNALGETVCTVEESKTDQMKDVSYQGNPSKDLPADPLQEPAHKQHLRGIFSEVMDSTMQKADQCIEDRLEDFVRATTIAARLKASDEELALETRIRMKAAPQQSVPVYSDLSDIAQESIPVPWLRETIEAMPQE